MNSTLLKVKKRKNIIIIFLLITIFLLLFNKTIFNHELSLLNWINNEEITKLNKKLLNSDSNISIKQQTIVFDFNDNYNKEKNINTKIKTIETWLYIQVNNTFINTQKLNVLQPNLIFNLYSAKFQKTIGSVLYFKSIKTDKIPVWSIIPKIGLIRPDKLTINEHLECFNKTLSIQNKTFILNIEFYKTKIVPKLIHFGFHPELRKFATEQEYEKFIDRAVLFKTIMLLKEINEEILTSSKRLERNNFLQTLGENPVETRDKKIWSIEIDLRTGKSYFRENNQRCQVPNSEKAYGTMNNLYTLKQHRHGIPLQHIQFLDRSNYIEIPLPCTLLIRGFSGEIESKYTLDWSFVENPTIEEKQLRNQIYQLVSTNPKIHGIYFYNFKVPKNKIFQLLLSNIITLDDYIEFSRPYFEMQILSSKEVRDAILENWTWYQLERDGKGRDSHFWATNPKKLQIWNEYYQIERIFYELTKKFKNDSDCLIALLTIRNNLNNYVYFPNLNTLPGTREAIKPPSNLLTRKVLLAEFSKLLNNIEYELTNSNTDNFVTLREVLQKLIIVVDQNTNKTKFNFDKITKEFIFFLSGLQEWDEPNVNSKKFYFKSNIELENEQNIRKFSKYGPQPAHLYPARKFVKILYPDTPQYNQAIKEIVKDSEKLKINKKKPICINEKCCSDDWNVNATLYSSGIRPFPFEFIELIEKIENKEKFIETERNLQYTQRTDSDVYFNDLVLNWKKKVLDEINLYEQIINLPSNKNDCKNTKSENLVNWIIELVKFYLNKHQNLFLFISIFLFLLIFSLSSVLHFIILFMLLIWNVYLWIIISISQIWLVINSEKYLNEYYSSNLYKKVPYKNGFKSVKSWYQFHKINRIFGFKFYKIKRDVKPTWSKQINQIYLNYETQLNPRKQIETIETTFRKRDGIGSVDNKLFIQTFHYQILYSAHFYNFLIKKIEKYLISYKEVEKEELINKFNELFIICEMNNFKMKTEKLRNIFEFIFKHVIFQNHKYIKVLLGGTTYKNKLQNLLDEYILIENVANYVSKKLNKKIY